MKPLRRHESCPLCTRSNKIKEISHIIFDCLVYYNTKGYEYWYRYHLDPPKTKEQSDLQLYQMCGVTYNMFARYNSLPQMTAKEIRDHFKHHITKEERMKVE